MDSDAKNFEISLPRALIPVLREVAAIGRPRLVGGCVRDALMGRPPGDWDIEVAQTDFDQLQRVLDKFGATDVVGRSFGTIKLRRNGIVYDFSLPRRESKTGTGHRGFRITPDPDLSDIEAAARRDFTINAIAWDPFTHTLVDPHGGLQDLKDRVLRHTSDAFTEDPLRVLRAMQFTSRFDLVLAPETVELCRKFTGSFAELAKERVWGEWDKWATLSRVPSRGLRVLKDCDWLQHFPEVAALHGTPQDSGWHPEGDVFEHTCHCLDALAQDTAWSSGSPELRRTLSFAVLAHDFGKPATTAQALKNGQLRWTSPNHANSGLKPTAAFLTRIAAPLRLIEATAPLVKYHMVHIDAGAPPFNPSFLRRLARKLSPATIDELTAVMRADARGRPPLDPAPALATIHALAEEAQKLAIAHEAPKPILQGRHLILRGLAPSPEFTPLLQEAFEAQLSGAFNDEEGSLNWLDAHLKRKQN